MTSPRSSVSRAKHSRPISPTRAISTIRPNWWRWPTRRRPLAALQGGLAALLEPALDGVLARLAVRRTGHQPGQQLAGVAPRPALLRPADLDQALAERDPAAYAALEMVEQPTGRDIAKFPFDWSAVGARKPVMVDEGLMTLDSMPLSQSQHWSGFALKTCKGHSFALTAAAWAHQNNMLLSLQDLTNPGLAAVHAALFAARVPTLNGVELNTMQFTPAANGRWVNIHPGLFHIQNGLHQLPDAKTPGLGGGA